ncbi:MAG TPA: MarR family winged helix-turn-helix transcriptional regulator [Candidatus Limnocylindrales bacterium]|nr:MarR family winged helix-turn-helix transcriptional regulator [Candidatus Limnocylindrales bacterium]
MSAWSVRLARAANGEDAERSGLASESRTFVIEDSLGYLLNRTARQIAHELGERIRPAGVAIGQWPVLVFLWARDGLTQAELSRAVAIEPPTMVRTIDRMVRDGLVTRAPDPDDGRLSRIYLTERARSLRDELVPLAAALNGEILSGLTATEARTLRRLLTKLAANGGSAPLNVPPRS